MSSDITARLRLSRLSETSFRVNEPDRKTTGLENLSVLVAKLAAVEFCATAAAAYTTSVIYYLVVLESWAPRRAYFSSALLIAGLVLLVSQGFRHYLNLQTQPLHRFLWTGIGAVGLAFSFFLSTLFLLKATDDYSRATFFFQLVTVAVVVLCVRAIGHAAIRSGISAGRVEAREHRLEVADHPLRQLVTDA